MELKLVVMLVEVYRIRDKRGIEKEIVRMREPRLLMSSVSVYATGHAFFFFFFYLFIFILSSFINTYY